MQPRAVLFRHLFGRDNSGSKVCELHRFVPLSVSNPHIALCNSVIPKGTFIFLLQQLVLFFVVGLTSLAIFLRYFAEKVCQKCSHTLEKDTGMSF
jgi:hypothetical protein